MKTQQQIMTDYVTAFLDGLVAAGIQKAVISPGSRSTPVSLLIHRDPRIEYYVAVDERSAAFFALGLAKASRTAVLLVCTSGTAAANYYPAICEAKASRVPLVVLITDRPPELQHVGAPQTMAQDGLFGKQVKSSITLAVAEDSPELLRYSEWQGRQAVKKACQSPAGPVHLNMPLREPLLPNLERRNYPRVEDHLIAQTTVSLTGYQSLFEKKGVVVVGEERTAEEARLLLQVADTLKWPIIGDPLTNLATCGVTSQQHMRQIDGLLSSATFTQLVQPEVILRFGRLPISKNVMLWLKGLPGDVRWLLVDDGQEWLDQLQVATDFLPYTVTESCQAILQLPLKPCADEWLHVWQQEQARLTKLIHTATWPTVLSETSAVYHALEELPAETQIFVSNSNAIRMLDRFIQPSEAVTVWGNRGVNGIDGIVSTAAGIACATNQPTILLTGDLALFHDMNGLQMVQAYQLPLTIVLLNNQGGGIFSFLSQRTLAATDFDPLFATPTHLEFAQVATLYSLAYEKPTSLANYQTRLKEAVASRRPALIEVQGTFDEPVTIWEDFLRQVQTQGSDR